MMDYSHIKKNFEDIDIEILRDIVENKKDEYESEAFEIAKTVFAERLQYEHYEFEKNVYFEDITENLADKRETKSKIKQLKLEWKNIIAYIVVFIGIVILSHIFSRITYLIYVKHLMIEMLILFIGVLVTGKLNSNVKKVNIGMAFLGSVIIPIFIWGVEIAVMSVISATMKDNGTNSLEMMFLANFIYHFIRFAIWLLLYVIVCKILFHVEQIFVKLKKYISISVIVCIVLAAICAFSNLIEVIVWRNAMAGTQENSLLAVLKLIEIGSKFDTTNLIILVKCAIMGIIGIGINKKIETL